MSNYNSFDERAALPFDQYTQRVATDQGGPERGGPLAGGSLSGGSPCLKAHKRPQVEYRAGASLLKISRGGRSIKRGGGKRGDVKGFSYRSRLRLMETIASIMRIAALPLFVTLTYPAEFPTVTESKKHLVLFIKCIRRKFPLVGMIWKLEPQERGAPHFHILIWGVGLAELSPWVPTEWHRIAGKGDRLHLLWHEGKLGNGNEHCVQQVRSYNGVRRYAEKYLGKTFEVAGWSEQWTGRFWGVVNRANIPFGELVQKEVTEPKALELMRYAKTFIAKRKKRKKVKKHKRPNNRSIKLFCDASHWIEKTDC